MKHATSRMLFAYWDALRGERAAPERADVEPGAIRHIMADTFVLGLERGGQPVFRLAGTRCTALFGRDLKDAPVADLWPERARPDVERHVEIVVSETAGLVLGLLGTAENGWSVNLEMILLPLRHRGRTDARALGALSPAVMPSWIGLIPVTSLQTTSVRVVNASRDGRSVEARAHASPLARRHNLVVHEGGRR